jgi:hypothetical protein
MLASTGLVTGHSLLADWFYLIAAILFAIAAVAIWADRPPLLARRAIALQLTGLTLVALGFFVL